MGSCMGGLYSCCCCECNFIIFPAPSPSYDLRFDRAIKQFPNRNREMVPYLQMQTEGAKFNLIYFHGNAQDIGYAAMFLAPIRQALQANIYAIQYPTYGPYEKSFPARISNHIKSDALDFYEYLKKISKNQMSQKNTIILGRSIGSGGASYLANQKNIKKLILISPFSDIPAVAQDLVGCVGGLVKNHFDNVEQIRSFGGQLLVIHGRVDEVINFRHGEIIVKQYQRSGKKCKFISPGNMTHNFFDYETDILEPITTFINQ